jgi:ABC-type amino acid transport system permease subunit
VNGPLEERRRLLRTELRLAVWVLAVFGALTVLTAIPVTAVLGTSLLVAAAANVCGALIGFLFGIPRISEDRPPREPGAPAVSPNTNLEQISNWLTKILVGVGLVQFNSIGTAVGQLIDIVARVYRPAPYATVLAGALIVLPTVIGFLASYIGARTWLFEMFTRFDGDVPALVRHHVHEAMDALPGRREESL